jgi:hypothetical protein
MLTCVDSEEAVARAKTTISTNKGKIMVVAGESTMSYKSGMQGSAWKGQSCMPKPHCSRLSLIKYGVIIAI